MYNKCNKSGPIPVHKPNLGQCWEWLGFINPDGYGVTYLKRRNILAHRLSYILTHGEIPKATPWILHKCDNRACVRPEHLYAAAPSESGRKGQRRSRIPGLVKGREILSAAHIEMIRTYKAQGLKPSQIREKMPYVTLQTIRLVRK